MLIRIIGFTFMSVWILMALTLGWFLITGFSDYQPYLNKLLHGAATTLLLIGLSVSIGAVLAVPIAFARLSSNRLLERSAFYYMYFFRGTPLIAQMFLVYYGLGSFSEELKNIHLWWFFRDAFYCAVFTFSLHTAAYQAEILRGAITTTPKEQWEAGFSLGLSKFVIFFKIILPQALIIALRPFGNEIVLMIKASAIASIITILDVMGETRRIFSRTFDYNVYIIAAIFYLIIVEVLRRLWNKLELRLTRHLKRVG